MSKYSTVGGVVTRSEAYTKLMHHLDEAADQAAVLSHLHSTEIGQMDALIAKGWLGVHQMLLLVRDQVRKYAATKFQ